MHSNTLLIKKEVIQNIKNLLIKQLGLDVADVILFGSQTNENIYSGADWDILILLNNDYDWKLEHDILKLCYEIDLKYDIVTDVHILSSIDQNSLRYKEPIFQKALCQGIHA